MRRGQPPVTEFNIVRVNAGISVPFGRSVYVDPELDLHISVRPGDRCTVRVIQNDPLSQRPGKLSPTNFPCQFGQEDVQYSHYGARSPAQDKIRLMIRYDSSDDTFIIPVIINVQVLFEQLEVVTKNIPLTVDKLGGVSNPIDNRVLQFTYDRGQQLCKISILNAASGLPAYGELVNDTSNGFMQDCDALLKADIRYHHTSPNETPNRDYIPMVVELNDLEGNLIKQEYFQMMVRIREGEDNTPPQLSFSALLLMDVNQFVMTAITPNILIAEDHETPSDKLIFNITTPLGIGEGSIVSTDDQNIPITSFYQKDLNDLKIAYKPPASDSDVRRFYLVEMEVVDSDGLTSEPFSLTIVVNPMNTLAPLATKNAGLLLFEGQSRRLQSSKNLQISDEDNIDDVVITVVGGMKHGRLLLMGNPVKHFTPGDLESGLIVYEHDGSDTYSDNIIFRLNDGQHQVEFLFPVIVYPEDDDAPILNVNTGLTITRGEEIEITPFVLSATDIDSDDSSIRFILSQPPPSEGKMLMKRSDIPEDPENWMYDDGFYEKDISSWTQQDLIEGNIFYRHSGNHIPNPVIERLRFTLSDDNIPPNESQVQEFVIRIMPLDNIPPELHPDSPLQMTVEEFQITDITRQHLRYTDSDTRDRELIIKITKPPYDTDVNNPMNPGKIVLAENPDIEITEFNQAQINHHKIAYKPPESELGLLPRIIHFNFEVKDKAGNTLPDQVFQIFLQPVDNKPPVIHNKGIEVFENGFTVITPEVLNAVDEDTDPHLITFTIVQAPKHGTLQIGTLEMVEGDSFAKPDIENSIVSYVNSGSEMDKDNFLLEVTDGTHSLTVSVDVLIKNIDDEAPKLEIFPGTLGVHIEVEEGGRSSVTSDSIKASDPDTDDHMITFIVEDLPHFGSIEVNGVVVDRFKQEDLKNGRVFYLHNGIEIGMDSIEDSFNLSVSDMSNDWIIGGNAVDHIYASVLIKPVDSSAPTVEVGNPLVVLEGNKSLITQHHLNATDADTLDEDVICTLIEPPIHGYLENMAPFPGSERKRIGIPVNSFTISDIFHDYISYVQSIHKGSEPIDDKFTFFCSDGRNESPVHNFSIQIHPTNDEVPEIYIREFIVMEGTDLIIDLPILNALDLDIPKDKLIFIVTKEPQHGLIASHMPTGTVEVQNFTLERIARGSTIVYQHDDSETTKDEFELTVTDGIHNSSKTLLVMIIPVDDETPRLVINDGLDVKIGETKLITNRALKAEDLDSDDASITYVIRQVPKHGTISYLDFSGLPLYNLTHGMNFTQADIDNELIAYTHSGLDGVRDIIKFDVTDGYNPFVDRYFWITVESIDSVYPDVINKGVELPEGGKVILDTNTLSTSDLNSNDELLLFTITRAPTRGHLENTDFPGVPITSFTQLDIAGSKIYYIHTSEDESKVDSFEFEVSDGYNSVYRTFRISITDVDNKKPIVRTTLLKVKEGGKRLITPFELKAEDSDTSKENIKFIITQLPINGKLLRGKTAVVNSFTMADISENLISYQHDGSETLEDSFSFIVTDDTHFEFYLYPNTNKPQRNPATMEILVVPVDNIIPQLVINRGATSITPLDNGDIGFIFSKKTLRAEDVDSPVTELVYVMTDPPKYGIIVNSNLGNGTISNFTQDDINRMKVRYVLNPNENATSDRFHFKIVDKGKNELAGQSFSFNWAWISLEKENYIVHETDAFFYLTLQRRGYLGETSFVGLNLKNVTAKQGLDFGRLYAHQVQFNPGQSEANWKLPIVDDGIYEKEELFIIELEDPVLAVLEKPARAEVIIFDKEDESFVFIPDDIYEVEEDMGHLEISVKRKGDTSKEMMVICSTASASARGTASKAVLSFSDYISRPEDHTSIIRFLQGEDLKFCKVTIIDDSLYEEDEEFTVKLTTPVGGKLGTHNQTVVKIVSDLKDVPSIYFGDTEIFVDENDGYAEVSVWRTGTDLNKSATVTIQSKPSEPVSAKLGLDYVGIGKNLEFSPGTTKQTFRIIILDDLGQPHLEGPETFELVLRMPTNAVLGTPDKITVTINDSASDLPKFQFKDSSYTIFENDSVLNTLITRTGDLTHSAAVRCYTRQKSAKAGIDYEERPNTYDSLILFQPGETVKPCQVVVTDDSIYEGDEEFRLVLGSPISDTAGGAQIGQRNESLITIKDDSDKPVIQLEKNRYSVNEPRKPKDSTTVTISVIRTGDLSKLSLVRIHTKDGSAKSGTDYVPYSKELQFRPNVSRHIVEVEILYDLEKEHREAFTIHLKPDRNMIAEIKEPKAIIYIQELDVVADVTFPTRPIVVSLRDYDDADKASKEPISGYPVVCITPCNPKYPDFSKTGNICIKEGINNSLTMYRWRVSAPSGKDGVTSELRDVESTTFFADTHLITLDSIYFTAGSRVLCSARAVSKDGDPGLELNSVPVTISREGLCAPKLEGSVGAEPFTAKMRYTGPSDPEHPNLIKLTIMIPHWDGMLPVISTRRLTNFELILSPDGLRVGTHKCSNLLDYKELQTRYGFITNATKNPNVVGEIEPYQLSAEMRSEPTLRFYRNLDLEACMWEFTTYYDMSELVNECGGDIATDGQVLNLVQSYVSVRVPLYVSYIFHSPAATGGWQHNDLNSQLRLTFVYDTAILWQHGIGAPEESLLQGHLYPTRMTIGQDGKLLVNFRTEPRFKGQFVLSHKDSGHVSMVMTPEHPDLTFTLELIRTEPTFAQPEQEWQFVSDYAVRDYSGLYHVKLIPCTVTDNVEFSTPPLCNPRDPVSFDLHVRFQQVTDPVPTEYSLNTQLHLMRKRDLWLSNGNMGFGQDSDASFVAGDTVYGRVMMDPTQNLGESFIVNVEKCFLCTGVDGYVPKYDPINNEYGCVTDSEHLLYSFKIIDKGAPGSVAKHFRNVSFNAILASDDPSREVQKLRKQSNSDGFHFDSAPLFQVSYGRQWFVHCIYTDRSKEKAVRGIGKRSISSHRISRTGLHENIDVGLNGRGTNMNRLILDYSGAKRHVYSSTNRKHQNPAVTDSNMSGESPVLVAMLGIVGTLLVIAVTVLMLSKRQRVSDSEPRARESTVVTSHHGRARVINVRQYTLSSDEHTEV
ncbi:FRAS1-related extracellular matrix protein 2-like [Uloborus diversus]|uniref:FRAS1-related extracellular matrix protein 2-like n=1 Tax=Uloborus diversus TaxID=327109 RepID=UPI00240A0B81|nr:FRAS1-related extracellular matrix protein 2-like [Uloborus diversus]